MGFQDQKSSGEVSQWGQSRYNFYVRHRYPLFKFFASFWLVPIVQICAFFFSRRSMNSKAPVALIVTSRSHTMSPSFSCLVSQLEKESIKVICHSVNYVDVGAISKIKHIYSFFSTCKSADLVFLDDTFLPISYALKFKWLFNPKVIQLWHSVGLFKRVGLDVNQGSILNYLMMINFRNFDLVIVSSEACREVIAKFMGLNKEKVIALGASYTDRYFNDLNRPERKALTSLKKTVVYAPTFRGAAFKVQPSPIPQVARVFQALKQELDCFICPHPHEVADLGKYECPFVLADSLDKVDILITDYSSIAMDYMLANPNGKLILFAPDVEAYEKDVGFYVPLEEITLDTVYDEAALIDAICSDERSNHRAYKEKYLTLCDGGATARLIRYLEPWLG